MPFIFSCPSKVIFSSRMLTNSLIVIIYVKEGTHLLLQKDISLKVKFYFWLFPFHTATVPFVFWPWCFPHGSLPHIWISVLILEVTHFPGCSSFLCCLWRRGGLEGARAAVFVFTLPCLLSLQDLSRVLPHFGMCWLGFLYLCFLFLSCLIALIQAIQKHACLLFATCPQDSAFIFLTSFYFIFIPQIGSSTDLPSRLPTLLSQILY